MAAGRGPSAWGGESSFAMMSMSLPAPAPVAAGVPSSIPAPRHGLHGCDLLSGGQWGRAVRGESIETYKR
eukprot:1503130-Rhodomonas_salina.1